MNFTNEVTHEALNCCACHDDKCHECPLNHLITCKEQLIQNVPSILEDATKIKAEILSQIHNMFAIHFSTYTFNATVSVAEVFSLLSKFAKDILEGNDGR